MSRHHAWYFDLPFDQYMKARWDARKDAVKYLCGNDPARWAFTEALWTKQYYEYHISKMQ